MSYLFPCGGTQTHRTSRPKRAPERHSLVNPIKQLFEQPIVPNGAVRPVILTFSNQRPLPPCSLLKKAMWPQCRGVSAQDGGAGNIWLINAEIRLNQHVLECLNRAVKTVLGNASSINLNL
jgi:hypothetical protein